MNPPTAYLVGQVFGLVDSKTSRAEFNPSFVERVRKMEFGYRLS